MAISETRYFAVGQKREISERRQRFVVEDN